MKYIVHILLIVFTSLLTSCTDHDADNHDADSQSTFLQVGAATYATDDDSQTLGEAEYVIKRARLYAFDGDVLDNMVYEDNISSNNIGSLLMGIKVTQTTAKTLYLIINEPDDEMIHSRLALINNPAAFESLEYQMADYFSNEAALFNKKAANFTQDKFCLPMFGKTTISTVPSSASQDISVQMTATRSLARVDVMVQKESDVNGVVKIDDQTTIAIKNTKTKGYFANYRLATAETLTTPTATASGTSQTVPTKATNGNSKAKLAFTFYTPERDCSTPESKLGFTLSNVDFTGKRMDFDVTIGDQTANPLTKIERNKVHKIYCTFTPKTTDVEIEILDWSDVSITGDIPSSEFVLSQSKVVMDWWNLGKRYDTSVSFNSFENVEFTEGDYYKQNSDGTFSKVTLPSWLTVTMPTFPAEKGNITLTYDITNGDHSDVYIKLKSGYITKYIQVVYDNGYLPADILQKTEDAEEEEILYPWTTDTPTNGIHLSKNGPKLPTENSGSTPWIAWYGTNNDYLYSVTMSSEHGTGLSNTLDIINKMTEQNAYVPYYCYNMGTNWYLPSLKELQTVVERNNYLGSSYALLNWLHWTSTKTDNSVNAYIIRGVRGDYTVSKLSATWTFRCIRNM